ncbi:MAG: hypothetical protein J6V84_00185 [Clostridia bacterium]|nr:hypothetical protein [Clostridia bacterium]
MTDIFIKLLNMSIVAGWLVVIVILLRLVLKKAPAWIFCVLWALVALRLLLPVSVQSKTSAVPSVETVPPEIVYTDVPKIHTGFETFNHFVNPYLSDVLAPPFPEEILIEGTLTGSINIPEKTPAQEIVDIATVVWLCGIAAMAVYGIISYVLLKRKVREAVRQEKSIFICDNVTSPFIMGVLFPRIYLPSSITETDAEMVIAHEQAHIKRKDHFWKPLGFLLLTVYWFNPLLWVAYVMFCKDIESACDEKVIKKYGLQIKKQYSEALLNCSTSGKWVTACPVAFGETAVKSRIKGVLNYKKPAFWIIIIAVLACIATSVFFLTDPLDTQPNDNSGNISNGYPDDDSTHVVQFTGERIVFDNAFYSSVFFTDDTFPQFALTSDNKLLTSKTSDPVWYVVGEAVDIQFYPDNFYEYLPTESWYHDYSAEFVRRNVRQAYLCRGEEKSIYYILYLNNGVTLMVFGYEFEYQSKIHTSIRAIVEYSVVDSVNKGYTLPLMKYEVYTFNRESNRSYPKFEAAIFLEKEGDHFTYGYRAYSAQQYCPYGTYRYDGDKLYLETADGKNTYVFERTDEGLKYISDLSSPLPMSEDNPENEIKYFTRNTLFVKDEESTPHNYAHITSYISTENVFKDVDGDGQYELCVILPGPTPTLDISSYVLAIYDGCDRVAEERIIFKGVRFEIGTDGSIGLKLWNEDTHYDFRLTDEGIICTNTETGEEKPFSEMGGIKQ